MGPIKRSIGTIQQHQHCTIPSTTSTMKIAILSLVLVSAVSIDGGVLKGNGMEDIHSIIETIDNMSKAATDLNTMNHDLKDFQPKRTQLTVLLPLLKIIWIRLSWEPTPQIIPMSIKLVNPDDENEGWTDVTN